MINTTVDLRSEFGPARFQGSRTSCLSFATSSAHEYKIRQNYLSVEYLFYHAMQSTPPKVSLTGTTMSATFQALEAMGQPEESAWPYQQQQPNPWLLPNIASPIFKSKMGNGPSDFAGIVTALDNRQPVILGLVVTEAFSQPNSHGIVEDVGSDRELGGHAVLAVGHGNLNASNPMLLIRNSWGTSWGLAGYAWLSNTYIAKQLCETAILI